MVFISADYRLLPPATGHDVLADIKDLFSYLETQVNHDIQQHLQQGPPRPFSAFEIDPTSLAVAGSSAGGICAYLAAIHASPQPKAVLSLYGMGGDCLVRTHAPSSSPRHALTHPRRHGNTSRSKRPPSSAAARS